MLENKECRKSLEDAVKNLLTSHYVSQHDDFFQLIVGAITDELAHIPLNQENEAMVELGWWINHYLAVRASVKSTSVPNYVITMGASSRRELFLAAINDWMSQRKAIKNVLNIMDIPKDRPFRKELVRHFNREVGIIPREFLQQTMGEILPLIGTPMLMEEEHIKGLLTNAVIQWRESKKAGEEALA